VLSAVSTAVTLYHGINGALKTPFFVEIENFVCPIAILPDASTADSESRHGQAPLVCALFGWIGTAQDRERSARSYGLRRSTPASVSCLTASHSRLNALLTNCHD